MIKEFIRKHIPEKVKDFINYTPQRQYIKQSFSQEGEDLMLDIMLNYKVKGKYVDIGSHHPFKFSNSYYFYLKGWSGLCVDSLPGLVPLFEKYRPRDIFVNKGISGEKKDLIYYKLNDPALNTFSKELMKKRLSDGFQVIEEINLPTISLNDLLDDSLKESHIDFMTIDIEGLEYEVICSNNWSKYSPDYMIIHYKSNSIKQCLDSKVNKYLFQKGYILYAKSYNSIFFKKEDI